ncbi:MAG: hypothetical protein IV100_32780 [Myxococcales bacterium]|nr:hypothetical protein [Myxococcales bacterium]
MAAAACSSPTTERQPCPTLGYDLGASFALGAGLAFGETTTGTFERGRFTGHPIAVSADGDVSLAFTFEAAFGSPVVYLYGPRDEKGLFGECRTDRSLATFDVPVDEGGEYLVLVGADPVQGTSGDYTLSVTCDGDACDGAACPTLLGNGCAVDVCATGFQTTSVSVGSTSLTCAACSCDEAECGAFQSLVFDTCVCDCQVPLNPAPVCGANGSTYTSQCFAECAQVPVAFDGECGSACVSLDECALAADGACPNGLRVEDGCPVCACANACDDVTPEWRPVCGTDGLAYLNRERLACETGGAAAVAYLGPCLPYCEAPDACALSCPNGLVPRPELGVGCFDCRCMPEAGEPGPFWCARAPLASGGGGQTALERLASVRTFADRGVSTAEGFLPVFGDACPSALCIGNSDCADAESHLAADLKDIGLEKMNADVACDRSPKVNLQTCRANLPAKCGEQGQCPGDATCGPDGQCDYGCPCLARQGANVYEPVCAEWKGAPRTFFSPCLANCAGAWPIYYPGECCDVRLTLDERRTRLIAIGLLCQSQSPPKVARPFADTACPPELAACEANPGTCCVTPLRSGAQ